ncbi:hypothetical protein GS457_26525 [Rhodococcus hoagii]|nr:hypothetical protein [Prescottella equi]
MKRSLENMGIVRTGETLLELNKVGGLRRHELRVADPNRTPAPAEFCENGAKGRRERGDPAQGDARVLRASLDRRTRLAQ